MSLSSNSSIAEQLKKYGIEENFVEENKGYRKIEQYDIDNYVTHTIVFDDNNIIGINPLITSNNWFGCDNNYFSENVVPTTNAGEFSFKVEEVVQKCHFVSGHVIMK